ncbi:MAG: hypothetical protein R2749_32360 [Acidimicrobiales bacterium]
MALQQSRKIGPARLAGVVGVSASSPPPSSPEHSTASRPSHRLNGEARTCKDPRSAGQPPPELTERLAGIAAERFKVFLSRKRDGLLAASVAVGLGVLGEFLAAEVTEKAGPKGPPQPRAHGSPPRHGAGHGAVGRPAGACRQARLRATDGSGEIRLDTWDAVQAVELMSEHMVARRPRWGGVDPELPARRPRAGRRCGCPFDGEVDGVGEVRRRHPSPTGGVPHPGPVRTALVVVYVDGFEFAGQTMIGDLRADSDGSKCPLGIMQGTTENKDRLPGPADQGRRTWAGLDAKIISSYAGGMTVRDIGHHLARTVQ